jgi:hypothetical protein
MRERALAAPAVALFSQYTTWRYCHYLAADGRYELYGVFNSALQPGHLLKQIALAADMLY